MRKYLKVRSRLTELKAEHAKSLSRKALGLMLETKTYPLLFEFDYERKWSFHTFFVLRPIDFVFIGKDKKVVDIQAGVKPFTFCIKPRNEVKYALELPDGMGSLFRIGEKIDF